MTKNTPAAESTGRHGHHDYLPAAGRDAMLPFYDLFTRLLGARGVHRTLLRHADIAPGARVLEIGCGTGNLALAALAAHPRAEITGTDPDPLALRRAESKSHGRNGIEYRLAYAQDLPFEDATFDRTLSAFMLHHIPAEVKPALAAEAFRTLRPGGQLHLVDVGGDVTPADGYAARRLLSNPHVTGNLGDAIPTLLRSAGFTCETTESRPHRAIGRITYYRATRPA
ncbi:class I SAM-dependent methyltransferase [Nocardia sp. NPDC057668]|uniref:class I SAM-dependent methyltransferase n=1 Tax=Nocardia sp. NPDC057668 TaxID=3346202 RepID=UPI0036734348